LGRGRVAALVAGVVAVSGVAWGCVADDGDAEPAAAVHRAAPGATRTTRAARPTTTTTAASTTTAPTTTVPATTTAPQRASGVGLGGCPAFPADNHWHARVDGLPVHPQSSAYVGSIGAGDGVKADFGSGLWEGGPIGIPVTAVATGQAKVAVSFDYADESDPGPYPIPPDALVEGGPDADGDRHVLVVEAGACRLYELFDAHAAGLPIAAGLVRYDEVAAGRIDHAIRVTVPASQNQYVWPARHAASDSGDAALPPMGLRLRLRADADLSGLGPQARVVAEAMQTYGVIVADNGSAWYLSGAPDERWDNDDLQSLGTLTGAAFEAVDSSQLMVDPDSAQAAG
jgi:hypothetical protein